MTTFTKNIYVYLYVNISPKFELMSTKWILPHSYVCLRYDTNKDEKPNFNRRR
jgi:hypothetical protein